MKQDCIRISKCNPWRCRTWVLPCQLRNVGTFKAVDVKSRSPTSIFPPPSVSVTSFCSCGVPSPPPPHLGSKAASVLLLMYLGRFKHHSKKWNISYFNPLLGVERASCFYSFFLSGSSFWYFTTSPFTIPFSGQMCTKFVLQTQILVLQCSFPLRSCSTTSQDVQMEQDGVGTVVLL